MSRTIAAVFRGSLTQVSGIPAVRYLVPVLFLILFMGGGETLQAVANAGSIAPILSITEIGSADKVVGPEQMFRDVVKHLQEQSRTKGYQFACLAKGGLSNKGDHEVWMHQVYEEHQALVRGDLMQVPEMQVYRNPKKGAIRVGGKWRPLGSIPEGNRLQRLIHFPEELLAKAMSRSRTAKWIETKIDINDPDFVDPMDEPEEMDKEDGSDGSTTIVPKSKELKEPQGDRILVELDEAVAVTYFNQVQNSGCLGGSG
ncbi:MAG: hypothetical protein AAEJ04_11820 [Planctomycetota bacterium]